MREYLKSGEHKIETPMQNIQVHHPPLCSMQLGRGWLYVNAQLSLYPIYYAVDMFRPLWAIISSQNEQRGETIQCMIAGCGTHSC